MSLLEGLRHKEMKEPVEKLQLISVSGKIQTYLTHSKPICYHYIILLQLLYSNLAAPQFQHPYNGTVMYMFYGCVEDCKRYFSDSVQNEGGQLLGQDK